ncbi:helix-turn-helix domain-containing protein [Nocardia sp. NPDC001965]
MDRAELGVVLRAARSRIGPAAVGMPTGFRRQVPGLRREEVAQLAGISVAYLTRLEQGRGPTPSVQVLGALARALRLDRDDRDLIFHLAGSAPPPDSRVTRQPGPGARELLDRLQDRPALLLSASSDVLDWNRLATRLFGDFAEIPAQQRNMLRLRFLGAGLPRVSADTMRAIPAEHCVGGLRGAYARYPGDDQLRGLVAELRTSNIDFDRIWRAGTSRALRSTSVTIDHPESGPLIVHADALRLPGADQTVVLYTPQPGRTAAVFRHWRDRATTEPAPAAAHRAGSAHPVLEVLGGNALGT